MNKLLLSAALVAVAFPALAGIGDGDNNSISGSNSGVQNTGSIVGSNINNGAGSGSTHLTNTSTNRNDNTAISGSNSSAKSSSSAHQGQLQGQTATSSVEGSGNSSVTIKDRKQAPAVFAPGLVAGFDCMGSSSVGGSVAGFGISGGGTHVNEDCINVYLSRELERKGDKDGSWGVLCESDKVKKHSKHCPQPAAGGSSGEAREERGFQNGSRKN